MSGYLPSCFSSKSSAQIRVISPLKSEMAVIHSTFPGSFTLSSSSIYCCFPASSPP
ncbi:hypothetical protein BACCOPRO_00028 [Phocaeicola coprophilus DSM 18228 = JCM 13818]|uniref:Uncharacterized protein n=1 Tax=Phocaeicola coprophilus DSM 18228 = JCM 13818 TaxID=547042 RepID=S0F409_9BACT|nr:hypothetical protein BACCOPRO_00028 [Phocaeicola coprophilus DSM 18228 = JCM 13818]